VIRAELAVVQQTAGETLPSLVDRAARALSSARTSAEVLEARDMAGIAYDAAKRAARLASAKGAHDTLVAAAHRAQADALLIESQAKRRLADEYDAAQDRGEVRGSRERTASTPEAVGASDLGLTHKVIHEARQIRDAEVREPGIVERALNAAIERGAEPTRAEVKKALNPHIAAVIELAKGDEAARKDKRDMSTFRKLWREMSTKTRNDVREWIASQK